MVEFVKADSVESWVAQADSLRDAWKVGPWKVGLSGEWKVGFGDAALAVTMAVIGDAASAGRKVGIGDVALTGTVAVIGGVAHH